MDKKIFLYLYQRWYERHSIKPPEYVFKVLEIWNEENAFSPDALAFFDRTMWNGEKLEDIRKL